MIQRDYILRMIADLAEAMAKILHLKNNRDTEKAWDEAVKKIEDLYQMPWDRFITIHSDELMLPQWNSNTEMADLAGEFLSITSDLADDIKKYELKECLQIKALWLLQQAEIESNTYSFNRMVLINKLKNELGVD